MNSRKVEKESNNGRVDEQSSAAPILNAEGAEKEISVNKFLDFVKVSCHVNDVISVQANQKTVLGKNKSEDYHSIAPNYELNLEKMVDNQLFHDILDIRLQNKLLQPSVIDSGCPISGNTNKGNLFQKRSTIGLAIGSFSRRTLKKIDCGQVQSENVQAKLYNKLDYVIDEGVVDSVLSFICPIPVPASFPHDIKSKYKKKEPLIPKLTPLENLDPGNNGNTKTNDVESGIAKINTIYQSADDVMPMRKLMTTKKDKKEPEVVIHVCDEVKNTSRDFNCSQRLLVNKMGYFAEVTAGQKLDEMDISVHCDIQIFDWLIKWMKLTDTGEKSSGGKSLIEDSESLPNLDANNVIPILVSAGFLQKIDCGQVQSENVQAKLYNKLDYVIDEGVVDSVLSFICPIPVPASFPHDIKSKYKKKEPLIPKLTPLENLDPGNNGNTKTNDVESGIAKINTIYQSADDVMPMRKLMTTKKDKKEPEVVIHVCDEVKNTSRDFNCSQRLLVNKMGYFAEVTAGQKLDEMDISVHCDIQIFDWLIKWMKLTDTGEKSSGGKSLIEDSESLPNLDANNVIPILVSAGFLQMEPLMIDCLSFCHARLCDVVRCSLNLSCLNDFLITRLAAMFTNLELEMVRDKKERLAPRLWIKLIQSLCEPEPEALRGHYFSLVGLFRCSKCGEHLTNTIKTFIVCQPNNTRISRWGQLTSAHVRDSLWNMNSFIALIFKERRSWRHVYWKLWGHCHFLYCCICESHFPVYKMSWCRFHPVTPIYLESVTGDSITCPLGRYPCCGQKAFRFETFPESNGCHFREHSVLAETERERQILQIMQVVSDDCVLSDPPVEDIPTPHGNPFWTRLPLSPQQGRQGLLPSMNTGELTTKSFKRSAQENISFIDESCSDCSESDSTDNTELKPKNNRTYCRSDFSSDGCESEQPDLEALRIKKAKQRLSHNSDRYWCGDLSARSNQDHQREYEEKAMKHIALQMNKNNGLEQSILPSRPFGGFFLRLETEWKDQLKHKSSLTPTNSLSVSNLGKSKHK